MHDVDAIVIGSGAGGLTTALALARAGKRVTVFEQHYLPGGWCHSFSLEGYQFSPGVHYIGALGPGGAMRQIYEGLGVADDLVFRELNPDGYDHVLIGRERFDIPKGKAAYAARLKRRFPREAAGIDGYLDVMERIAGELGSGITVRNWREAVTLPARLRTVARWGWMPLGRFLDHFTRDPLLRAILSMQAGDHGVAPSRAATALHAMIVAHYFDGGWYPEGGARALPRAFVRALRRHGGEVRVRTPVDRILVEGGRALGVRLADGTEVRAPVVVSNADPHVTLGRLVGREHLGWRTRWRLDRTRYSISALSLFMAARLDARAAGLDSGNYWYARSADLDGIYDLAFRPRLGGDVEIPGVFLTVPTLKDPTKRADGVHTMESFCFVSYDAFAAWARSHHGDRPEAYGAMKEQLTSRMLDCIERFVPGLRDRLVFSALGTPLTNEHYVAATKGNLYGTEKSLTQLLGYPIRTEIPGLWMCGASTLGHGVAGATLSGLAAAKDILRCRRSELLSARGQQLRLLPSEPAPPPPEAAAVA